MMHRALLFVVAFLCISGSVLAQKHDKNKSKQEDKWLEDAEYYFADKNYLRALPLYKNLSEAHPDNPYFHYQLGICYLAKEDEKEKAVTELEEAKKGDPELPRVDFYLGRAYHLNYKFDDAINEFNYSLANDKLSADEKLEVNRYLEYCVNAKKLLTDTAEVTIQNIGSDVNTENSEYCPVITIDESTLIFTY